MSIIGKQPEAKNSFRVVARVAEGSRNIKARCRHRDSTHYSRSDIRVRVLQMSPSGLSKCRATGRDLNWAKGTIIIWLIGCKMNVPVRNLF